MDLLCLSRIYVTAVEFFEDEHDNMIDSQTLKKLISELETLNQKSECLLSEESSKIKYILLILKLYGKLDSIQHLVLSKQVIRLKNEINI